MAEHELKCWPNAYDAIASGAKRFEWRRDDRGYEVGDVLILTKWDPEKRRPVTFTDIAECGCFEEFPIKRRVRVTYILRGMFGVPDGFCVMSIQQESPSGDGGGTLQRQADLRENRRPDQPSNEPDE